MGRLGQSCAKAAPPRADVMAQISRAVHFEKVIRQSFLAVAPNVSLFNKLIMKQILESQDHLWRGFSWVFESAGRPGSCQWHRVQSQ
jgi:hypothetical protein